MMSRLGTSFGSIAKCVCSRNSTITNPDNIGSVERDFATVSMMSYAHAGIISTSLCSDLSTFKSRFMLSYEGVGRH